MLKTPMRQLSNIVTHPAALLLVRVAVGGVFLLYGAAKAMAPLGQFQQSIRDYHLMPEVTIPTFAVVMVVLEIAIGLGLILGIYTRYAATGAAALLVIFLIAIGQAMARSLDLPDCGCSGGIIKLGDTPVEVFVRDVIMLVALVPLLVVSWTQRHVPWTVDKWFERER